MSYLDKAKQTIGTPAKGAAERSPSALFHHKRKSNSIMNMLFKKAIDEIQEKYLPGLLGHIRTEHPDLQANLMLAEEELETAWADAIRETGTPGDFERALKAWQGIILAACNSHRA